jgi:hypothetical protein
VLFQRPIPAASNDPPEIEKAEGQWFAAQTVNRGLQTVTAALHSDMHTILLSGLSQICVGYDYVCTKALERSGSSAIAALANQEDRTTVPGMDMVAYKVAKQIKEMQLVTAQTGVARNAVAGTTTAGQGGMFFRPAGASGPVQPHAVVSQAPSQQVAVAPYYTVPQFVPAPFAPVYNDVGVTGFGSGRQQGAGQGGEGKRPGKRKAFGKGQGGYGGG